MEGGTLAGAATEERELDVGVRTSPPPRPLRTSRRLREIGLGYLLLAPSLVIFGVFVFYPFLKNFYLGFFRTPPFPGLPKRYVGFDQYRDVLGSEDFRNSLWVTVKFAVLTVPVGIVLGVALAVLAHQRLKGITLYRTVFSSTVATSVAVASVAFLTLLNPQVGLLNYYLDLGSTNLLNDPTWALPSVAAVTVWQNLGFTFILMIAALQAIPDDMLEAAQIDGAGPWRRFWGVTLPLLSPTIFFAVIVGSITAFQAFGQIDLLTSGGPGNRTDVVTYSIYTALRESNDDGKAAVLAIALFLVILVLTLFQLRFLERRVFYGR